MQGIAQKLKNNAAIIIIFAVFVMFSTFNTFAKQENSAYDAILQSTKEPLPNILIIGMDDYSIEEYGQWPWPRIHMAEAIDALTAYGAAAIGVDVLYDTYGAIRENDELLVNAAKNSGKVTFASMGVFSEGIHRNALIADNYIEPFNELKEVSKVGHINFLPDSTMGLSVSVNSDGVIRTALEKIEYEGESIEAFPVSIYKTYQKSIGGNAETIIPADKFSRFHIDFVGPGYTFSVLSFASVINGEYPPDIFKDAIALIGPYTPGIGKDHYYTPLDAQSPMYGVEIHANIVQNLIEGSFKTPANGFINTVYLLLWGMAAILAFKKFSPQISAAIMVLLILLELGTGRVIYDRLDIILQIFYPAVLVFSLYIVNLAVSFLLSQREKRYISDLFGRFVAPEVVNELISGGKSIELGGILREVTVMFVDIRGFTSFSEVTPPDVVVSILNEYLDLTTNAVFNNKGTLDKFIGDATMAVFNAPNTVDNHPYLAVKAAYEMQEGANELQRRILDKYGVTLKFGIGINTGNAVVGNIGSQFRMDYTVIGDTVNTAARLESNAKPNEILISHNLYKRISDKIKAECLGNISVKGKQEDLLVYKVTGLL